MENPNKIIWTKRELEEWARDTLTSEPPWALLTVAAESEFVLTEGATVKGRISGVYVCLLPGVAGSVLVNVSHNNTMLIPPDADLSNIAPIERNDQISVVVKNSDKIEHTIGVRVEIDEEAKYEPA